MLSSKSKAGSEDKAGVVATRSRRALGDITNASAAEPSGREVTKKPTLMHVMSEVVQHASSVESVDESEKMEEDERSYMRRESDDIDARDEDNPLLVTEYVNEMYDLFRESEKEFAVDDQYMLTMQPYVNEKMRAILADWLVLVPVRAVSLTALLTCC